MPWSWVDTEYKYTPSTAYTKCSIHRVQHTLSTASTEDCLSSLRSHDYELTPEYSCSFRHTSIHNRPPSASSPWELKGKVTLSHSHSYKLTNWWIESRHPACRPSTASKYSTKLAQLRPLSAFPNSVNHSLQVNLQTRSITASKCISNLGRLRPPSSHHRGLQVYLKIRSITSSKCIPKLAPLWLPSSLDHGLQVSLQTRSITASTVYLQTRSITASKFISNLARSRPPSVFSKLALLQPPSSHNHSLCVHLQLSWSRPPSVSPNSLDRGLQVHLQTRSIVIFRHTLYCPSTACSQSRYSVCRSVAI